MQVYTYSEAARSLPRSWNRLNPRQGPYSQKGWPDFCFGTEKPFLSVGLPSVKADISTQEIVDIIREGRERGQT